MLDKDVLDLEALERQREEKLKKMDQNERSEHQDKLKKLNKYIMRNEEKLQELYTSIEKYEALDEDEEAPGELIDLASEMQNAELQLEINEAMYENEYYC